MKTCPVCRKEDLHDEAIRCPYCRSWQSRGHRIFLTVLRNAALILLLIFMLLLGYCAILETGLV
jgi:hypothetical protein